MDLPISITMSPGVRQVSVPMINPYQLQAASLSCGEEALYYIYYVYMKLSTNLTANILECRSE